MAVRPPPSPPPRAELTPDRMRQGISRLERCIAMIEAFDPQTIQTPHDTSKADELTASVDGVLVQTFGDDTADYRRYSGAKNFSWPLNMARPTPIPAIQESLVQCRARSLALLRQAASFLKQELELSGSVATEKSDVLIVALDIDGDDPYSTARGHDHVEAVIGDRDPDPRQRNHHVVGHGKELPLHPDLDVDHRNDRHEVRMRPEELVLLRFPADGDRHDANGASAFHTREITTKFFELDLVFVEVFSDYGKLRL